jgi:hypothetical protein
VVQALPSAHSASAEQQPATEAWAQVPFATLQVSVVHAESSAQSAFLVQQPPMVVCWHV